MVKKRFLAYYVEYYNHMTLKLGVALELMLQLGNNKLHDSDFCVVCKANKGPCQLHYH